MIIKSLLSCALMLFGVSSIDVDKLLKSMSLEEKIGQLNQITINEFTKAGQVDYDKVYLVI